MCTEFFYSVNVEHFFKVSIVPKFNFLNFVRGAETIKEVDKCNFSFDCSQVSNRSQIHNFLRIRFSKHCNASLATSINVRMITKNVQCLSSNTACSNMEYTRKLFSSNLVHIRNHQKKTLRSCESCCQCTRCQRTVYSTSSTSFRFHFDYFYFFTENIFLAICRPVVNPVSHWRRRSDRINTSYFSKSICNVSCSLVSIH